MEGAKRQEREVERLWRSSGEEITVTGTRWSGGEEERCLLEVEPEARSEDCRRGLRGPSLPPPHHLPLAAPLPTSPQAVVGCADLLSISQA